MEKRKTISIKTVLCAAVIIMIAAVTVLSGMIVPSNAYAETDVVSAFEQTDVMYDLRGSTIAGNEFSVTDYPHRDDGYPQVITFTEYCYSSDADKQADFGLYVYIYNPQDKAIAISDDRNKIQFGYGKCESYAKYGLQFLNYSTEAGYEGRFYKFKVALSYDERERILRGVEQDGRVYRVVGIELVYGVTVTEYAHAQTYTYSGYALGCGSELATADSLTCTVDGFDTYVDLEVNHTLFRAEGDYYNGEQSQLNSCYFRIPNRFFTDYGELTKIACEWYEYFTKPMLVTEDPYIYGKADGLYGRSLKDLPNDIYFLFVTYWTNTDSSWFGKKAVGEHASNYTGFDENYRFGFLWGNGDELSDVTSDGFAAAFYTGGAAHEEFRVSGDDVKSKLQYNSEKLGGEKVHGVYSKALFEDYVQSGYKYGHNEKEINADDEMRVFWNYTTKSLWQKMFGGMTVNTVYDDLKAIVMPTASELEGTNAEIAARLYVNETDVNKIKAEYKKACERDETLVLFRYSTTKYFSAPCAQAYVNASVKNFDKELVKRCFNEWDDNDYRAHVVQETVYLDFDIISLTYTNNGVDTVIPVVSSPTDVIGGLDPPLKDPWSNGGSERSDRIKKIIKIMIAVLIGVLLIVVLVQTGLIKYIASGIAWIVTAPFKAIANAIKRSKAKKKE